MSFMWGRIPPSFEAPKHAVIDRAEAALLEDEYSSLADLETVLRSVSQGNSCYTSWNKPTLVVRCLDCRKTKLSCICLDCYRKGNHDGHRVYYFVGDGGNCDCGDERMWDKEGFCELHNHAVTDPDLKLPERLRNSVSVIRAVWIEYLENCGTEDHVAVIMADWLQRILTMDDGMRRVVIKAMTSKEDMDLFLAAVMRMRTDSTEAMKRLIGGLASDWYFTTNFGTELITNMPIVMGQIIRAVGNNADSKAPPLIGLTALMKNMFHFVVADSVKEMIQQRKIVWKDVICQVTDAQLKFLLSRPGGREFDANYLVFCNMWYIGKISEQASMMDEQHDTYMEFVRDWGVVLSSIEGKFRTAAVDLGLTLNNTQAHLISYVFYSSCASKWCHMVEGINEFSQGLFDVNVEWIVANLMDDSFDARKSAVPMYYRPVFGSDTNITLDCYLGVMACRSLMLHPNPRQYLQELCSSRNIDFNEFCRYAAILPLRWLAAAYLADVTEIYDTGRLRTVKPALAKTFGNFFSIRSLEFLFFSVVQFYMAICTDKDAYLRMICSTFGLYDKLNSASTKKSIEIQTVLFIMYMLTDRVCIERDKIAAVVKTVVTKTRVSGSITIPEMQRLISPVNIQTSNMTEALDKVVTMADGRATLTDGSEWNVVLPWLSASVVLKAIEQAVKASPTSCLPFPSFVPFENPEWDMTSVLHSKYLYALLFDVIHMNLSRASISLNIALGGVVLCANYCTNSASLEDRALIAADAVEHLTNVIPDNFHEFMRAPVIYKRGCSNTLLSILTKLGGAAAKIAATIDESDRSSNEHKNGAKKAKKRVLTYMKQREAEFDRKLDTRKVGNICGVCKLPIKQNDESFYMVAEVSTAVPSYVDRLDNPARWTKTRTTQVIHGCTHEIHANCVAKFPEDGGFQCPTCGKFRNGVLPKLKSGSTSVSRRVTLFRNPSIDQVSALLADQIVILEARFRAKPEVLDDDNLRDILCSMFETGVIVSRRSMQWMDDEEHALVSLISRVINELKVPATKVDWCAMHKLVLETMSTTNCEQPLIFLRRVVIMSSFMLRLDICEPGNVIDWDYELSAAGITARFHTKEISVDSNVSSFLPLYLPDRWVDLIGPPYNFPIADMRKDQSKAVDLVTGKLIAVGPAVSDMPDIATYGRSDVWRGAGFLVLMISGSDAPLLQYVCLQYNRYVRCTLPWVDTSGVPVHGFHRNALPILDRTILSNAWDEYLSGRIMDRFSQ